MKHQHLLTATILFSICAVSIESPGQTQNAQAVSPPVQTSSAEQVPADVVMVPDSSKWSIEEAIGKIRSSKKGERLASVRRLANEPGKNILRWLSEAAQFDPIPRVRYESVQILSQRPDREAAMKVLVSIAEKDKDIRVRNAAWAAANPPATQTPANNGSSTVSTSPNPSSVVDSKPIVPAKTNEQGHELPPGYGDVPSSGQTWSLDDEMVADEQTETTPHYGFLPVSGFDGAIGSPRDTLARTSAGLLLGVSRGSFKSVFVRTSTSEADNEFTFTSFDINLVGRFSPVDFVELGIEAEAFTFESQKNDQTWFTPTAEDQNIWEPDEYGEQWVMDNRDVSGAAIGLVSANAKLLFVQNELLRLGMAVRMTFPTHSGGRFDKGVGNPLLYDQNLDKNETQKGLPWVIEPGVVASIAPFEHLTAYLDFTFLISHLRYRLATKSDSSDTETSLDATNFWVIPHLGAQYRLMNDKLGIQLGLSPVVNLGKTNDPSFVTVGIVPGLSYSLPMNMEIGLTAAIETGPSASKPMWCTGDTLIAQEASPLACGVGRRFGLTASINYKF